MSKDIEHNEPKSGRSARASFALAVGLMLLSGFGFALMSLFVRLSGDLPTMQKSFFRNFVVFFVALIFLLRNHEKGKSFLDSRRDLLWLILRSVFGSLGVLANFYSIAYMPIANASMLNKLSPFFTVLFSALFLKERVTKVQFFGIMIAFTGVIFISRPESNALTTAYLFPIFIAILGGVFAAAAYTSLRYLGKRKIDGSFVICFFSGFSCLLMSPSLIFNYAPMTKTQWIYMLLIGIGGMIGQYGVTYAYRFASANQVSIFDYSNVVFTTILGIIVLGEVPGLSSLLGGLLIFVALLVMFAYNLYISRNEFTKKKPID